jgi:peptidoglycan/xylan/chitin deacetylase (PgdA/CDA1 family)
LSAFTQRTAGRRVGSGLVLGLLVTGTAFLVQAQVEGMGSVPNSKAQAAVENVDSCHSGPVAAPLASPLERIDDPPGDADVGSTLHDLAPAFVRRLAPTPAALPLPTPSGIQRQGVVPILMYHHVAVPGADADGIRRDLSVSPANFEAQLRYLIQHGYEPTTLGSLILHLQIGEPLPPKPVILTFDDGFKDQYTNAYPLLKKYGFVGTFFVITRFADEGQADHMSWPEIELLHADGMEIGSHSYTHPSLAGKSFDYVVWQVLGSKEAIEARTCEPVRVFSYPSGQYDQLTVDVLKSAGYWGAVTVESGSLQSSERPFELKRISVRGTYDLGEFDHWLNHWLAHP